MNDQKFKELLNLLESKRIKELRDELLKFEHADIVDFLEKTGKIESLAIFRILPKDVSAEVFAHFDVEDQERLLNSMTNAELTDIVDKLYIDDVVDMLEELPANVIKKVMTQIKDEKRKIINQYLQYPEDSAGSIMTAEFIDIKKYMTVGKAIDKIRKKGMTSETIYTLYITDAKRRLEGFVSIRTLIMSEEHVIIEDLMDEDVIFAHTTDDQEDVAKLFSKYGFLAIPVVDNEKRLVGIVTFDDAVDVMTEEATEDFELMSAMTPSERPYLKSSAFEIAKNRFAWLLILLITATFTGFILTRYEDMLTAVTGVIAFVPMLTGAGGNAGAQSSTMIIRGLALGEIEIKDYGKIFVKELGTGVLIGTGLSVLNFLRIWIFGGTPEIALAVSASLFCTIILAKSIGGLLPIGAQALKLDPAVMAAPLITTIVDTLSLLIYVFFVSVLLI